MKTFSGNVLTALGLNEKSRPCWKIHTVNSKAAELPADELMSVDVKGYPLAKRNFSACF